MADVDMTDAPAPSSGKKPDGKKGEGKKRFEVKKVGTSRQGILLDSMWNTNGL
jgi:hypothetical protein